MLIIILQGQKEISNLFQFQVTSEMTGTYAFIDRFFPAYVRPRPANEFTVLIAGSFIAAFIGVLILLSLMIVLIRAAMSIQHLIVNAIWGAGPITNTSTSALSAEQKKEIDDLRSAAIRDHLFKFTTTLMINPSETGSLYIRINDSLKEDEQEMDIDDDIEFAIGNEQEEERASTSPSLANALDSEYQESNHDNLHHDLVIVNNDDPTSDCAICHEEYKASEKICRSSNPKCKHVFHEECIVQWLVSSGWRMKERTNLTHEFLATNLLNYDLTCPCCRRSFVDKSLYMEGESGCDEIV